MNKEIKLNYLENKIKSNVCFFCKCFKSGKDQISILHLLEVQYILFNSYIIILIYIFIIYEVLHGISNIELFLKYYFLSLLLL